MQRPIFSITHVVARPHPHLYWHIDLEARLRAFSCACFWLLGMLRVFYGVGAVGLVLAVVLFANTEGGSAGGPRLVVPERVANTLHPPIYNEEVVYLVGSEPLPVPDPNPAAHVTILLSDTAEREATARALIDLMQVQLESEQIALHVVDLRRPL